MSKKSMHFYISVIVADDHELIRQAITTILAATPNITVIGMAVNGQDAIEMALKLRPDILLMDIQMPIMDGIKATEKLYKKNKKIKTIILSAISKYEYVEQAICAGACGYIIKNLAPKEMIDIIEAVFSGEKRFIYNDPQVLTPQIFSAVDQVLFSKLSPKEKEVFNLILSGCSIHEMTKILLRDERTLRMHRKNIRQKLGVKTDAEIIMLAVHAGFYFSV